MRGSVRLTPDECRLARYSLRQTISQFSGKVDFNPEDWPAEQREQAAIRRLLRKLNMERAAVGYAEGVRDAAAK